MTQTPVCVFRTIDQADPEDREAGSALRQWNWRMPRKVRFAPFQSLFPVRRILRCLPLFQLRVQPLLPFEIIRSSLYSPPHSVGPDRCSASSSVDL